MPKSKVQKRLAGLALHHPEKVYPRNRSILKMTNVQLRDFAEGSEKGLPYKRSKKKKKGRKR